jgi:carbon storage regulator
MLVLTRRLGEEVVISGDIRVMVVECIGNKVRLGITAPSDVKVDRREVHERRLLESDSCVQPVAQPANKQGRPTAQHRTKVRDQYRQRASLLVRRIPR